MNELLKEKLGEMGRSLAKKLDDAIASALDSHLGKGAWTVEGLAGRLTAAKGPGQNFYTYFCDGVPLLRVWPIQTSGHSTSVRATQRIEMLLSVEGE